MNLKGIPTNPGELRTKVTLERPVISQDSGGFSSRTSYTEIAADVLVKWTNAHGAEVWEAEAAQAKRPATVWMRYRSDIDVTCVVKKCSTRYEIVSLDNVGERDEYIELKVKVLTNG